VREIAAALAAAGQDDGLVQHMPHRAIRWRAEHDKLGYEDISPISAPARAALEACTAIPAPGGLMKLERGVCHPSAALGC
jgi:hypothetical protein